METTLFNLPNLPADPAPHPSVSEIEADVVAVDLRLHYVGLAHFFGGFAPAASSKPRPVAAMTERVLHD